MRALSGLRVGVAGAGVFGLSIAARCAQLGALVTVFEARERGDNASGVAAGMLAPGLEAILEPGPPQRQDLLLAGYRAWPGFLVALDLPALPELTAGALYVGSAVEVSTRADELAARGFEVSRLSVAEARSRQTWLGDGFEAAIAVPEDGRLEPLAMLQALEAAVTARGGLIRRERLSPQAPAAFDALVLALGPHSLAWRERIAEFQSLQPIKGHVLHFAGGPVKGPVVRSVDGYAAPQPRGTIFGATMEWGLADDRLDQRLVDQLHRGAASLFPALAETPFTARTGVRVATPDGAPMVGRTASGIFVATGARRNGWLYAPLVADAMVAALQGAPSVPAFDPGRFQGMAALTNA